MIKLKSYELNQNEKKHITGGEDPDCYVVRRVGNCDNGATTYYFWNSCTGQCTTLAGNDVDDCTPCNE